MQVQPRLRLLMVLLGASLTAAQASGPPDPAAIGAGHPTGHAHDHGDLTWPPQPRGMRDAVSLSNPGSDALAAAVQGRRALAGERMALARRDVRQALGARFSRIALVEKRDKSGISAPSRLVYFSHANNATVEITMEGAGVRRIRAIPPAEYQPEPSVEETTEAAALARQHFLGAGRDRIANLQAFGILAYRPEGKGFFDSRVLYISFHADRDAPPQFAAWVDLTHRQVLRTREEQP